MVYEILIVVYLLVALCLIGLVLIQQGKGADMGASFGSGSSGTVFGSGGSGNFLTKSTTYLAIAFFIISLVLGNLTANRDKVTDDLEALSNQSAIPGEANAIDTQSIPAAVNEDVPSATVIDAVEESDVPQ